MINNSINAENKSTGLFINFIKAFELVTHEVLLMKMEAAGVRGSRSGCGWGSLCAAVPVKMGVPQVSLIPATDF